MKKTRKNRFLLLTAAILLAALILPGKAALAYFTDYQQAAGEQKISLAWQTKIHEQMEENDKHITIENTGDTNVLVRVAVFAADYAKTEETDSWKQGEDGWWYYNQILAPGKTTEELVVTVTAEELPEGDAEIIVVHESARAVYENGSTLRAPADWMVPDPWIG